MKSPYSLWEQAQEEHPDDEEARRARYLELMIEHGLLVRRPVEE